MSVKWKTSVGQIVLKLSKFWIIQWQCVPKKLCPAMVVQPGTQHLVGWERKISF